MDDDWDDDLAELAGEFENGDFDPMEARRGRGRRGGARVYNLFGKRQFDYTFLASPTLTQTVMIRRALPVIPQYYLWLLMRVHNLDIPTTGSMALQCFTTLPSKQDPREFSLGGASPLSVTATTSTGAGTLLSATANNQGPFLKVQLVITQPSTPTRLYAELSAVLYGRPS